MGATKLEKPPPGIAAGQPAHFGLLAVLLAAVTGVWAALGAPAPLAFWCAVALPVAHQATVWLTWRLELRSQAVSRAIGFTGYLALFFTLFGGRFVSLGVLAWIDRGSLGLPVVPRVLATTALLIPAAYAGYSVGRYFGMERAAGADHFDPRYRDMPLVREGIFRYTSNGMYVWAFLSFWAIALAFDSSAALAVAAFSHAYIWVHFHCTEKPDMAYLYGGD